MAGRKGRRGWGRIRQLPNKSKRYQANYVWPPLTGARHNAPTTFSTRALAERWLAEERRLIETGQWAPPKTRMHREIVRAQTFADYANTWLAERAIKDSTRKEYRRQLDAFVIEVLGPVPLHALDAAAVRSWFAGLATTEHRKHKVYWLLHSICATAVSDGLLSPNPCQLNVKKPERQVKPVILEPAEITNAVKLMEVHYRAPALIAAWCGLRWGELGELRRADIKDGAEFISVERTFEHDSGCGVGPTKSGKDRLVAVPPHIRADIKHHLDVHTAEGPQALLLPGKAACGHLSPATFRKAFHDALQAAGVQRVRLHDLRHFTGVMTARTGATLTENMARLGHSTAAASLIYQDVVAGRDAEVAAALSALAEAAAKSA